MKVAISEPSKIQARRSGPWPHGQILVSCLAAETTPFEFGTPRRKRGRRSPKAAFHSCTNADRRSKLLHVMTGHHQTVRTLAMVDASTAVSGSLDRSLRVWNVSSGACLRTLEGHTDMILCMVVHGDRVVSGSEDGTARVWSVSTGSCLHELRDYSSTLYSMKLCHDKAWVAVGASDGGICIWDIESGQVDSSFVECFGPLDTDSHYLVLVPW